MNGIGTGYYSKFKSMDGAQVSESSLVQDEDGTGSNPQ